MLYVDGMNGVINHNATVQWLYSLLASKVCPPHDTIVHKSNSHSSPWVRHKLIYIINIDLPHLGM